MKSTIIITIVLIMTLFTGCKDMGKKAAVVLKNNGINVESGDSVSILGNGTIITTTKRISTASVNGIELKYTGKVTMQVTDTANGINIDESSADISFSGSEIKQTELQISYNEFKPQDATIYLENSTFKARSKSGKPVLIFRIEGVIPRNLKLNIKTDSGDINLTAMQDNPLVSLSSDSGDITIKQAKKWQQASAETDSGDIYFEINQVQNMQVKTDSGDLDISNSNISNLNATTDSGDIHLKNTKIAKRHFSQGSGDLYEE